MPLKSDWSKTNMFNGVWTGYLTPVVRQSYTAEIEVFYTNITGDNKPTLDATTWKYSYPENSEVILFSGLARVQPIRAATAKVGTYLQTWLFSVDDLSLDVRPKHKVRVVSCANNTVLPGYKFVVTETGDSSNLVERTFYAQQDTEV